MRLSKIDINGSVRVDASEVLKKSGIEINFPLLLINTAKVRKQIKQIPLIEDVHVDRNFPNKISINIFERTPKFAVFNLDKYFLIDEEGYIIEIIDKVPDKMFLIIKYIGKLEDVRVGKRLEFVSMYDSAFWKTISEFGVNEKEKIRDFIVDNKGISVILNSGVLVFLGKDDKFLDKLRLLPYIKRAAMKEKINTSKIDINYIETPYIITNSQVFE